MLNTFPLNQFKWIELKDKIKTTSAKVKKIVRWWRLVRCVRSGVKQKRKKKIDAGGGAGGAGGGQPVNCSSAVKRRGATCRPPVFVIRSSLWLHHLSIGQVSQIFENKLEKKGLCDIKFFAKGKRGLVFTANNSITMSRTHRDKSLYMLLPWIWRELFEKLNRPGLVNHKGRCW